jgi:3-hydroxyisobutyrate dehydrogenase
LSRWGKKVGAHGDEELSHRIEIVHQREEIVEMKNVAWIGLGRMGLPMATHLVRAGLHVTGYDLSDESMARAEAAGIAKASSIKDAVASADIVFTMLPQGADVLGVYKDPEGILAHASQSALLVDSSTISIAACSELHSLASERGFRFLDAPVSGGTVGAEAGTLAFMVGGEFGAFEAASIIIEPMSSNIFHTGGPTTGQVAKICNNLILFINLSATAEGAVLAERLGLDKRKFFEIASVSSADSWPLRNWYPIPDVVETAASSRDFDSPTFTARLARKDVSLAVEAAHDIGHNLTLGETIQGFYDQLIEDGLGEKDCSIVSRLM